MFDRVLSLAIRLAATAVGLGWLLSAMQTLDRRGYLFIGLPAILIVVVLSVRKPEVTRGAPFFRRLLRWWKGRRLLPLIFLFICLLVICGSLIYQPNNFDALTVRIPRVLYWTTQHHWYWIHTPYPELNYLMPNYEWLSVPVFFLTGGFHADVVIDWISFLFLPSLFFTLLRAFGTPRRLAWDWMWLLPSGSLIAIQAGSIANDLPGLAAILAALHCANRFCARRHAGYLLDAFLAAGLCTGIKLSSLPLAGFALIILLRDFKVLVRRPLAFGAAAVAGIVVSAFIPLVLNLEHTGSILGVTTSTSDELHSPVAGLAGNSLVSFETAFAPPLFPEANKISAVLEHSLGHSLMAWLQSNYPSFSMRLNELPQEEGGALGLAITIAVLANVGLWMKFRKHSLGPRSPLLRWQLIAWWSWLAFAVAVISSKLGTGVGFPREMLPWYPLLLAPLIACFGRERISRSALWRWLAPLLSLSIVPALLLTPSRPLIPPSLVVKLAHKCGAPAAALERLDAVYDVYAHRDDVFAELKRYLPSEAKVLALASNGDEPTASWWKPFGSRRCVFILSDADVAAAQRQGIKYIVLTEPSCQEYFHTGIALWLKMHHAREIKTAEIRMLAATPPIRYTLAQFE